MDGGSATAGVGKVFLLIGLESGDGLYSSIAEYGGVVVLGVCSDSLSPLC
jgi:hypothetical protein